MSEITKEPVEQLKQAFKERLSSPLWGYVFLSWLGFNWPNIARLFMSKRDVEVRISEIASQEWFFVHYIILPIVVGSSLAAASPYLQQWLSSAHKRAEETRKKNNLAEELRLIDDYMIKKKKAVELANVAELAEKNEQAKRDRQDARNKNRLEFQKMRNLRIEKNIDSVEQSYTDAKNRLEEKLRHITEADEEYKLKLQKKEHIAEGLNNIAKLYHLYDNIKSREDFASFLSEINKRNYFSPVELDFNYQSMAEKEIILNALTNKTKSITFNEKNKID